MSHAASRGLNEVEGNGDWGVAGRVIHESVSRPRLGFGVFPAFQLRGELGVAGLPQPRRLGHSCSLQGGRVCEAAHIRNDGPLEVVRVVALDGREAPTAAPTLSTAANVTVVGPRL
jgi:hypothetical protein